MPTFIFYKRTNELYKPEPKANFSYNRSLKIQKLPFKIAIPGLQEQVFAFKCQPSRRRPAC